MKLQGFTVMEGFIVAVYLADAVIVPSPSTGQGCQYCSNDPPPPILSHPH